MTVVNKFNVNNKQVRLDADIIENMSANDVSYDASTQYDENTVGDKLSELEREQNSIKESLSLKNIFENNSFTTSADNPKVVYYSGKTKECGLYFCEIDGLTTNKYISLYNESTLIQEDVLILTSSNKSGFFIAKQSFNTIKVYSPNTEVISFKLYDSTEDYISKRVSNLEVYTNREMPIINNKLDSRTHNRYITDFDLEVGNINLNGQPTNDANNIRSSQFARLPTGSNYVWVNFSLDNSYYLNIYFYNENKDYISVFLVHSSYVLIKVPNNATYYKILLYDRPPMSTVVNANISFSFIIKDSFIESELKSLTSELKADDLLINYAGFKTYANDLTDLLQLDNLVINKKYLIYISGNTNKVYINLYDNNTIVKKDIVVIEAGGGQAIFSSNVAFNRISIRVFNNVTEYISVFLFSINENHISEKIFDIEQNLNTISYTVCDKPLDTNYYKLTLGNIYNGYNENTKNVRTSCFYSLPPVDTMHVVADSWEVAVFFYSANSFNSHISTNSIAPDSEKDISIPSQAKYYMLLFWGNTSPTLQDIRNDGATISFITESKKYAEETRALCDNFVTSSFLEARKHYTTQNIIIKPLLNLNRENGNIIWKQDKRLCQNPLTTVNTPDPTVVKIGNYYYMACTGFPIRVYRSIDMVNWEFYRNMFDGTKNDPFNTGTTDPFNMGSTSLHYWAPSMFINEEKVYIYIYTIDEADYKIASTQLFVANSIDSNFSWVGTVHASDLTNNQFRDTQYFKDTDNVIYISTGDSSASAKRICRMSPDLITVDSHWVINSVNHEGTLLYKHNGYYYLFFSGGRTDMRTYDVRCFRSRDITLSTWEDLGILLKQLDENNPLNSTGHVGEIIEDKDSKLFMYMHCHCYGLTDNDSTEYGKRYLYLNQIVFDSDNKPHFVDKDENIITEPQWFIKCPNL